MSLFGEFSVPSRSFALQETLAALPGLVVEIERVVASEETLTPYFWVADCDLDAFEAAAGDDPSVADLRRLDEFDEATLYRADWKENVEALVYAYTDVAAVILEATGRADEWDLRMRFDDREALARFREHCRENGVDYELRRLYGLSHPRTGGQFGLTPKQQEALLSAWEAGYFGLPRESTLEEVADDLDITQQALSERVQRGLDALVENTLAVTFPDEGR